MYGKSAEGNLYLPPRVVWTNPNIVPECTYMLRTDKTLKSRLLWIGSQYRHELQIKAEYSAMPPLWIQLSDTGSLLFMHCVFVVRRVRINLNWSHQVYVLWSRHLPPHHFRFTDPNVLFNAIQSKSHCIEQFLYCVVCVATGPLSLSLVQRVLQTVRSSALFSTSSIHSFSKVNK
jgi:hypothetical protein